jgi:BMFP domain-containing protein YqiC
LDWVSRVEVKTVVALASAREDVECFARKIALLEAEVATEH